MRDVEDALVFEGLEIAAKKVREFLAKVLKSAEAQEGIQIVVSQAGKNDQDPVYSTEHALDESLDELIEEIMDATCEDAEDIGRGRIKYTIHVDGIRARCTFSLKIPEIDEDEEDIDELPNGKGAWSLQMRHNEKLVRILSSSWGSMQDRMLRMIDQKDVRIEKLEKYTIDNIKQFEELVSARHVRDIEMKKLENDERRKDQVAGILLQGVPVLFGKLMGGGEGAAKMAATPGARTPLENMLEGLLGSMSREQFMKIVESGVFGPDQIATLMEIAKFVVERHEAEQKTQEKQQNGVADTGEKKSEADKKPEVEVKEGSFE